MKLLCYRCSSCTYRQGQSGACSPIRSPEPSGPELVLSSPTVSCWNGLIDENEWAQPTQLLCIPRNLLCTAILSARTCKAHLSYEILDDTRYAPPNPLMLLTSPVLLQSLQTDGTMLDQKTIRRNPWPSPSGVHDGLTSAIIVERVMPLVIMSAAANRKLTPTSRWLTYHHRGLTSW